MDGMTIPVVNMDSQTVQARKRLRVVGDVEVVQPKEVEVHYSIQMPGPTKKPKLPCPPEPVLYASPQLTPKPSTSQQSVPSTSFLPPDCNRFVSLLQIKIDFIIIK